MGDLILVDGYTLTVNGGIKVANNHSLTIYGQSGRTGKLTATTEKTDGRYAGIGGDMNSKFGSGPVFPCFVWRPQATSGHSLSFADRGRGAGRLPTRGGGVGRSSYHTTLCDFAKVLAKSFKKFFLFSTTENKLEMSKILKIKIDIGLRTC